MHWNAVRTSSSGMSSATTYAVEKSGEDSLLTANTYAAKEVCKYFVYLSSNEHPSRAVLMLTITEGIPHPSYHDRPIST